MLYEVITRALVDRAPDTAGAWNALGLIANGEGRISDALACYRRALAIDPDLVPALVNLGSTLV